MMRKIDMYQCEICKSVHYSESDALRCENKGKETPLASIGDLVQYRIEISGGYADIFTELRIKSIEDKGHYLIYYFEEYYPDYDMWDENIHFNSVWGNDEFKKLITVK